uniref:Uncharacterized protein n=1 Tax=Myotis myotis TaxID=51298 RepID=A0A7J8AMV6_MYOMY|nr:hypothetical protein mMyoMyo1_008209 [Myotis myotis]
MRRWEGVWGEVSREWPQPQGPRVGVAAADSAAPYPLPPLPRAALRLPPPPVTAPDALRWPGPAPRLPAGPGTSPAAPAVRRQVQDSAGLAAPRPSPRPLFRFALRPRNAGALRAPHPRPPPPAQGRAGGRAKALRGN